MVTPDKDFGQLVFWNIFYVIALQRMGNGIEIGDSRIQKRFWVVERPEQVIDYLGMMGAMPVINILDCLGCGEKTHQKF